MRKVSPEHVTPEHKEAPKVDTGAKEVPTSQR